MSYKKAFKCSKCPQTNSELGCPVWVEYLETNSQTGDQRTMRECGFQMYPKLMLQLSSDMLQPAREVSAMRESVVNATQTLLTTMQQTMSLAQERDDG